MLPVPAADGCTRVPRVDVTKVAEDGPGIVTGCDGPRVVVAPDTCAGGAEGPNDTAGFRAVGSDRVEEAGWPLGTGTTTTPCPLPLPAAGDDEAGGAGLFAGCSAVPPPESPPRLSMAVSMSWTLTRSATLFFR